VTLQNYEILSTLGAGATAQVFKARNLKTDKLVALKAFSPVVINDAEGLSRLRDEVEILRRLTHPNVVSLIAEHSSADEYFLELELVEGSDLKKWRAAYQTPLLDPLLWILCQVLKGLGAAHEQHIIHRDLKPENILISRDGAVKITDFGLARSLDRLTMTKMGLIVGSLGYMAPEIVNGERAGTASDIFSFGAIAYELLTGQCAFRGDTPQTLIKKIVDQDFTPIKNIASQVPRSIAALVESCLQKDPSLRPKSVWSIEAEIMNHLLQSGIVPLCRGLVSEIAAEILPKALKIKHQNLSALRAELLKKSSPDKDRLFSLANELRYTFPDDASATALFLSLRKSRWAAWRSLVLWPGLAFFVLFIPALLFHFSRTKRVDVAFAPVAVTPPTLPALVAKTPPTPKPVHRGVLQFEVDPGVRVAVDSLEVPTTSLRGYPVRPGRHTVRLLKSGFDPIESAVMVSADRTTTIRARGILQ